MVSKNMFSKTAETHEHVGDDILHFTPEHVGHES